MGPQYVVSGFGRTPPAVRLPPSRAKRASASLAEAFGGGGKADITAFAVVTFCNVL